MNDKELNLIESIKSESRASAERNVKRAISQFVNDIGSAKIDGKSLREIILELDSEQIIHSLTNIIYEQTLDTHITILHPSRST